MFVFDGGLLSDEQAGSIRLLDGELQAFRFCTEEEASKLLRPYVWRRMAMALGALKNGGFRYLHNGHPTTAGPEA